LRQSAGSSPHLAAHWTIRRRAALADAAEDMAEADFDANPCEATARILLRKPAADRLASLAYDRDIAARHGLTL
jgi:hypothetical protein